MKKLKVQIDIKGEELKKKLNIKDGVNGIDGKDGKDAVVDTENIALEASKIAVEKIKPTIPTIEQIEQDLPKLGERIRDSLELLEGSNRLDKKAILGLEDYDEVSKLAREPKVNKVYQGGGGARQFIALTDVPNSYTGQAGKFPKVNAGETGLVFDTVDLSGYVPYTGATQDVDLGSFALNASSIKVNGTNGAGHIHLKHQASDATSQANSTTLFADSLGDIKWKNDSLYYTTLKSSSNTADRTYTFPNVSGTVALTSDLSGLIDGSLTPNELVYGVDSNTIGSLSTSTYPSLSELAFVKGVTSAIQTQLNGKQASGTYVTGATNASLTLTGTTLGINLANSNTWTGAITVQVGTNADGVFQIKNSAGSNRFGYSTSKDQLSVGDAGYSSSAGFFYIYDVTHSFKDVFTIVKGTWGSAFDIQISTLSPVIKATGGSTFVSYTINDTGTYLYNAAVTGATFDIRNDTDNYGTYGFYAKGYNNNPAPSSFGAQKRAVSYGVVGEAQSNATGFGGAGLRSYSASSNIDGVRVDVLAGQTAPLFRARLVNSFYDTFMTSAVDIMRIEANGAITPASLADASAANGTIYYSTTQGKLCYRDIGGTVNNLY